MRVRPGVCSALILLSIHGSVIPTGSASDAVGPDPFSHQVELRRALGFRHDIAFLRQMSMSARDASKDSGGIGFPVLPHESLSLRSVSRLSHAAPSVRAYGEGVARAHFSGMYIDSHSLGGLLHVGFTSQIPSHAREIVRFFPFPDRLRFFRARFTARELEDSRSRLISAWDKLLAEGVPIVSISSDERAAKTVVGVSGAVSEAGRRLLFEVVPAEMLLVVTGERGTFAACNSRTDCWPPQTAGTTVVGARNTTLGILPKDEACEECEPETSFIGDNPGGGSSITCVSNYSVWRLVGGIRHYEQLVAGHCALWTTDWKANLFPGVVRPIGPSIDHSLTDGTSLDAGLVELTNQLDKGAQIWGGPSFVMAGIQPTTGDTVGDIVCSSGRITGTRCGVIENRDYSVTVSSDEVGARRLVHQRIGNSWSGCEPGDSGSPVFDDFGAGDWAPPYRAVGIMTAFGNSSHTKCIYGHIGYLGVYFEGRYVTTSQDL